MQTIINNTPVWITYLDRQQAAENRRIARESRFQDDISGQYTGWYFCCCIPGCMPDSDWNGPYRSETAAHKNAVEFYNE